MRQNKVVQLRKHTLTNTRGATDRQRRSGGTDLDDGCVERVLYAPTQALQVLSAFQHGRLRPLPEGSGVESAVRKLGEGKKTFGCDLSRIYV